MSAILWKIRLYWLKTLFQKSVLFGFLLGIYSEKVRQPKTLGQVWLLRPKTSCGIQTWFQLNQSGHDFSPFFWCLKMWDCHVWIALDCLFECDDQTKSRQIDWVLWGKNSCQSHHSGMSAILERPKAVPNRFQNSVVQCLDWKSGLWSFDLGFADFTFLDHQLPTKICWRSVDFFRKRRWKKHFSRGNQKSWFWGFRIWIGFRFKLSDNNDSDFEIGVCWSNPKSGIPFFCQKQCPAPPAVSPKISLPWKHWLEFSSDNLPGLAENLHSQSGADCFCIQPPPGNFCFTGVSPNTLWWPDPDRGRVAWRPTDERSTLKNLLPDSADIVRGRNCVAVRETLVCVLQ